VNRQHRFNHPRRGATMVEFALSFLLFLTVVIAVFEGGLVVWSYTTLNHAARQGARQAMVHNFRNPGSDDDIINTVKANAVGLFKDDVDVSVSWEDATKPGGSTVTVAASYPLFYFANDFIFSGDSITLTANSTAVLVE
jgi:Flp pilus assembly protein TadG